jgi:hypothetical protein
MAAYKSLEVHREMPQVKAERQQKKLLIKNCNSISAFY